MYDIIIVGGGPAGLCAALYALRAEKRVLILEKNNYGGQIAYSPRVENYPGIASLSGMELTDSLLRQLESLGAEIDLAEVSAVVQDGGGLLVKSDSGDFHARAVILATGATHRALGLTRESELTGRGVSYCALCDAAFAKGGTAAIVGGGDAAVQDAILLADVCKRVYLIHRRGDIRAERANVTALASRSNVEYLMDSAVTQLLGEDELEGIVVRSLKDESERSLSLDGLFIAIGYEAANESFGTLADIDERGWFASGENCLTKTPGVFVAGDCRAKDIRQLTTAMSDGAVAAVTACRYIDSMD